MGLDKIFEFNLAALLAQHRFFAYPPISYEEPSTKVRFLLPFVERAASGTGAGACVDRKQVRLRPIRIRSPITGEWRI